MNRNDLISKEKMQFLMNGNRISLTYLQNHQYKSQFYPSWYLSLMHITYQFSSVLMTLTHMALEISKYKHPIWLARPRHNWDKNLSHLTKIIISTCVCLLFIHVTNKLITSDFQYRLTCNWAKYRTTSTYNLSNERFLTQTHIPASQISYHN